MKTGGLIPQNENETHLSIRRKHKNIEMLQPTEIQN